MNVPASQEPNVGPTIVRMASIPHGVTLLMQGPTPSTAPVPGPPKIPSVYPVAGLPAFDPEAVSNGPFPSEFQDYVDDPNSLLRSAIAGQTILGTITIQLATGLGTNLSNIPFLGTPNPAQPTDALNAPNAFVYSSAATFWIEWVHVPDQPVQPRGSDATLQSIQPFWPQPTFLQLQYSQVSILIFNGVLWPHVNVATLTLSAG